MWSILLTSIDIIKCRRLIPKFKWIFSFKKLIWFFYWYMCMCVYFYGWNARGIAFFFSTKNRNWWLFIISFRRFNFFLRKTFLTFLFTRWENPMNSCLMYFYRKLILINDLTFANMFFALRNSKFHIYSIYILYFMDITAKQIQRLYLYSKINKKILFPSINFCSSLFFHEFSKRSFLLE